MTLKEVKELLETAGYPVAYEHFEEAVVPSMPFICFAEVGSNNFGADGRVYQPIKRIEIQLFTKKKDIEAEGNVEQALSSLFWQKDIEYSDDELCYRTIYQIED